MFTIKEIVDLAAQIERNAEKILRAAQKEVSDPELLALLQWLENEERQHVKWLARLNPVPKNSSDMNHLEKMGNDLLKEMLDGQTFSLGDTEFSKLKDVDELISTMVEFEKDTVLFYQMISSAVSDHESLNLLERIISEENRHAERLKAYLSDTLP